MDYETIPLSRLETALRATLDDCVTSGRWVIVELPDNRRIAIQPLGDGVQGDDELVNNLIEHNAAFRAMLERSDASGTVPFGFELEAE